MERRSLLGFIALNVVVTFLVAFLVIGITGYVGRPVPTTRGDLLRVVITATPDPNETPRVVYVVVTATSARPGGPLILPTPEAAVAQAGTPGDVPTLDPSLLPSDIGTIEAPTLTPTDPSGCPTHTLAQGEYPGLIAQRYGVSVRDLLAANGLTEQDATRLRIGRVLIVPINGCGLKTATPTEAPSPTLEITDTPPPTSTRAPTAATTNARIEISQIISPGDITAEGIELRNISGVPINLKDWKIEDSKGNTFTFPELQMFENRRVILYTRAGTTGPLALFWGLPRAILGDSTQRITITNADGIVQLTYTLADGVPGGSSQSVPIPTAGQ